MNIAVLGSGAGGCAVAFDCAKHGHRVNLFDFETFPEQLQAVKEAGGIFAKGALNGFATIHYAGHDIEEALTEVEMIIVVGPAYSTRPFAEACRPHLRKGQMVLICPGSCGGSLEFKIRAGLALDDRIHIYYRSEGSIVEAFVAYREYIMQETLAVSMTAEAAGPDTFEQVFNIDGNSITFSISKA